MSYHHLTRKERGMIALLVNRQIPVREIARQLGRSPGTISREIRRNRTEKSYHADTAQACYLRRRTNSCRTRRYEQQLLCEYIVEKLLLAWSPEQVAGRIQIDYPNQPEMRVSFSSIYRWLHKGMLPRSAQLKVNLRHDGHRHGEKRGVKSGARELRHRCRAALQRRRLGDWEVDTLVCGYSGQRSYLLNMTDRKSRYCCLAVLRNASKAEMLRVFSFFLDDGKLPVYTMTSDRGGEFNCHHEFEERFGALYYYTRPASPWQKPTVENQNGLIRQFFPKGTDFSELSHDAVPQVMSLLNNRPRKLLNWLTPAELMLP